MKKKYWKMKTADDFCVALVLKVNELNKKTAHGFHFDISELCFSVYYYLNQDVERGKYLAIAETLEKNKLLKVLEKLDGILKEEQNVVSGKR